MYISMRFIILVAVCCPFQFILLFRELKAVAKILGVEESCEGSANGKHSIPGLGGFPLGL
jgi:hypothetical protein